MKTSTLHKMFQNFTRKGAKSIATFSFLSLLALNACSGAAGVGFVSEGESSASFLEADFGDAPDMLASGYGSNLVARFPSRLSSNGARHADVNRVALGMIDDQNVWPNTEEADATDSNDSDGVQNIDEEPGESDNDAQDDGLLTMAFGDDEEATLQFSVTAADDSPQNTYYVNVLFDWNKDGQWKGQDANGADEWAVKNMAVSILPGQSKVFRSPVFTTGLEAHPAWVRMTVSEEPVDESAYPEGWDGTGEFSLGETEDYFLANHQVLSLEDDQGKGLPGVPGNPFNPRPVPPFPGGGGGGSNPETCEENYFANLTLCEGRTATRLITIGGFAPDSLTASSNDPSVASVTLNEANVVISGNQEGTATINVVATQGGCTYYLTITVKVKKCPPAVKVRIECCSPEEIRRDPAQCDNCHIVGRQHNQTNTQGGGGTIPETDMEGRKTNVSKSYVVVRDGGLIDVITVYYDCDPCPAPQSFIEAEPNTWLEEIFEEFFTAGDQENFGGENGVIDDFTEYDEMAAFYDEGFDEAIYECATRHFEEVFQEEYGEFQEGQLEIAQ